MTDFKIHSHPGGCTFQIHVLPRAGQSKIVGVIEGALRVRIAAPPVDGAANEMCIQFFSRLLHVPKSNVVLIAGVHHKRKVVLVQGCTTEDVRKRLSRAVRKK